MNERRTFVDETLRKFGYFSLVVAVIIFPSALWSYFFRDGSVVQLLVMTVVGGMALIGSLMMVRQYVIVDNTGIEFRNLHRVFHIEWKQIRSISYPTVGVAMMIHFDDPSTGKSRSRQVGAVTRRFGINRTPKGHIEQIKAAVRHSGREFIEDSSGDESGSLSFKPAIDEFRR